MGQRDFDVERFEGRIILALPAIAEAQLRLAKTLSRGRMDSDMVAVCADLRAAANQIEQANEDYKKTIHQS